MQVLPLLVALVSAGAGEVLSDPQSLQRHLTVPFENKEANCDLWFNPYLASESYSGILVAQRCSRGEGREQTLVAKESKLVVVEAATLETVATFDVAFHAPPVALVEWPGGAGVLQARAKKLQLLSFQGQLLGSWEIPRQLSGRYAEVGVAPKASFWPQGPAQLLVAAEAADAAVLEQWELAALDEQGNGVAEVVQRTGERQRLAEALEEATNYSATLAELFFRPKILAAAAKLVLPVEKLFLDRARADVDHAIRTAAIFPTAGGRALLVTQRPLSFVRIDLRSGAFHVVPMARCGDIVPISAAGSLAAKSAALAGPLAYVHVAGTVVEGLEQYEKRRGQPCRDPIADQAMGEKLCLFLVNMVARVSPDQDPPSVAWTLVGEEDDGRQMVLLAATRQRFAYLTTGKGAERSTVFLKTQRF